MKFFSYTFKTGPPRIHIAIFKETKKIGLQILMIYILTDSSFKHKKSIIIIIIIIIIIFNILLSTPILINKIFCCYIWEDDQ